MSEGVCWRTGGREGRKAQVSSVTLNKSLNLCGPLALYLAVPAAPSHPSDLGSYVTSSERPSLTLNKQFGFGGISTLSMIKMSLWFIFRLGPLGAGALPLLFTSVFPPLICHLPGRMSEKSSGLELWRPGFIILTPPHMSYKTRGKQPHHLSGPQFPYLENGRGNLPSRTTGKTGALICARAASTELARHGCSVHIVGFPSLFLLSRGTEKREATPNLALIRPLMTPLPA